MAERLPFQLRLNIAVGPEVQVHDLWTFVRSVLLERPDFRADYWRLFGDRVKGDLDSGKTRGAPPEGVYAARGAAAFADGFEVQGEDGGLLVQPLSLFADDQADESFGIREGWRIFDLCSSYKRQPRSYLAAVARRMDVFRAALARFRVRQGDLRRVSNTYLGPFPPLALPEVLALLAWKDEVVASYTDAEAFWTRWDRVEDQGAGSALCSRNLDVVDETAHKARVLEDGFALCRRARDGLVAYCAPDPSPEEQALLDDLPRSLIQAGYDAQARSLELTAVVEHGAHLTPADLLELLTFRDVGTEEGHPVETLIVTFPHRAMAEAEAKLLHAIGARVQFLATDGSWETLQEPKGG